MNRALKWINLAGVLALAILCVIQWSRDRALNLEINRLEKARIDNEAKIQEQEKAIRGLNSDLALFKEQLTTTRSELKDTRDQLRTVELENINLSAERDQLRISITNWMEAVTLRDERIKEANERIQSLANDLNDSIGKFNELATNYNNVVADLNRLSEAKAPSSGARQ